MKFEPAAFVWDGRAMVPLDRFRVICNRQYRPGVEYSLVPHRGRSEKAHGLYFACIKTAWENLPEDIAPRFPTDEYLRKWCLVEEGYADENSILCDNEAKARTTASLCRKLDRYAVIKVNGPIVTVWTAQSQDHHNMGHEPFQQSMDKVLSRLADMLGITIKELTDAAKGRMKSQSEDD